LDVDGLTTLNDSLHVDLGAGFGDDIWVAGNSNVAGNSQVDGGLNVDGATTLNSTLDVDGATTLNSTLDVDGHTELNDSLHVDGSADIDGNLNVDGTLDAGTTDIDGSLDVSGHTELNDSLHVDGSADIDGNLNVDGTLDAGTTDIDGTLDVSGHTELNDSLHVDLSVGIDQNLWVGGNTDITGTLHVVDSAQFDSNVNIDATLTSDSVIVEESMKIYTPTYEDYSFTSETLSEPEFEILNVDGDPIFEVDGHNDDVIAENLTVNGIFTTQDWIVNDDISCDGLSAAGVVTSGNNNYGSEWGTANQNQNNWLTRRDYVDFHRQAATGVLQAFSYDADLIATSNGDTDYNESVYYMDGDLVLYADSVDVSAKNYVITVKGTNFNSLVDEDGADLTIEAAIWAENNKLDITSASHNLSVVDDNTITFEIGYADINGIVACTSGKVRPTLALGSATYGMQMTGLHFFIELEEAPAP
jgi:cytoskeletal protein CcmA (bactofilin family)